MDLTNIREVQLSNRNTIHIDERIDSEELKGGCRVLYCNNRYFPYGVAKYGYWYSNGEYDGQMYFAGYSRLSRDWWIDLYPKNWWRLHNYHYTINSSGNCFRSYDLHSIPESLDNIQHLLMDIIMQLEQFSIRHSIDLYRRDIKQLRMYLNKYNNEILDIDLKNGVKRY